MDMGFAIELSRLVLGRGIALKRGQCINIVSSPKGCQYASVMAREAYRMGAKYVGIVIQDPNVNAVRVDCQKNDDITFIPHYLRSLELESLAEGWARIRIDCPDETLAQLPFEDKENAMRFTRAMRENGRLLSSAYSKNRLPWCVCCIPGPLMAKAVLGKDACESDLVDVLSKIYRFGGDDALEAWDEFDRTIESRISKLDSMHVKTLHFVSASTNLRIGLSEKAHFAGGSSRLPDGRKFFPNLPTEEMFTTPDMYKVDGHVKTTRPVSVLNEITENVTFFFKDGLIVDAKAEKGQKAIDALLDTDKGTRRIGEIALVDENGPIAKTGLVFGSSLIDENASCHMAIGSGYEECIEGGLEASGDEELEKLGINTSSMHVDFMIGSPDMDIDAETYDGRSVPVMRKGSFAI